MNLKHFVCERWQISSPPGEVVIIIGNLHGFSLPFSSSTYELDGEDIFYTT